MFGLLVLRHAQDADGDVAVRLSQQTVGGGQVPHQLPVHRSRRCLPLPTDTGRVTHTRHRGGGHRGGGDRGTEVADTKAGFRHAIRNQTNRELITTDRNWSNTANDKYEQYEPPPHTTDHTTANSKIAPIIPPMETPSTVLSRHTVTEIEPPHHPQPAHST